MAESESVGGFKGGFKRTFKWRLTAGAFGGAAAFVWIAEDESWHPGLLAIAVVPFITGIVLWRRGWW